MITVDDLSAESLMEMSKLERKVIFDNFQKMYANKIQTTMSGGLNIKQGKYNPMLGNDMTQSISSYSKMPTPAEVETYLKDPHKYAKQLREISNYYEDTIMQYKRTLSHFKEILTFRYDLRLMDDYDDENEEVVESVLNARKRCNSFLKKFDVPYHTRTVMDRAVTNGGGFYYMRHSEDFISLLEMPVDYCYVTGRWDRGLTYAVDLTFFDVYRGFEDVIPEMYEYYKIFIKAREMNAPNYKTMQYYPVPIEDGFVFTFDTSDTSMIPPLSGVFRDATAIFTYKNLLMQRTALETWKVIAQKIPLDKNDVPILSAEQAQIFVDFAQSVLPSGTAVFATPMEIHEVDFSGGASTQNNIVGRGEELFWRSVGVNGALMDAADKSSATMKYSLMNDEGFVDSIYQQFADFINLHLKIISRKYGFAVKFYGNRHLEREDIKLYKDVASTTNGLLGKYYALQGYEPFEIRPNLKLEKDLELKKYSIPIISGYQQSGEIGADEKAIEDLTDSGLETRDSGANEDKAGG